MEGGGEKIEAEKVEGIANVYTWTDRSLQIGVLIRGLKVDHP